MQSLADLHPGEFIVTHPVLDERGNEKFSARTYLVISKNSFHQGTESCICLSMNLDLRSEGNFFVDLNPSDVELDAGKSFNQQAKIDCGTLFTFRKGKIRNKYGMRISSGTFSTINEKIKNDVLEG